MRTKRFLAMVLSAVMILSLLPTNLVFAASDVKYVDASGNPQTCTSATDITNQTTWENGWYYVSSDVEISDRITVSGTVNLILADDATLTASAGIAVLPGNTLIIWAQSGGTGKLIAKAVGGNLAGIGGKLRESAGTITINGGVITATGATNAAGIGGGGGGNGAYAKPGGGAGTITINGGNVTAIGGENGSGIGGGRASSGGV